MKAACAVLLVLGFGITAGCKRRTEPPPADPLEARAAPVNAPEPAPLTLGKRGTFTVGKSTTFVLGPIDSTGHIDYVTAINDRLSKGVTAANNANVAIWNVIGPNPPGEEKVPAGFFEKMGMAAPPATGNYFVGVKQYAEKTAGAGTGGAALDATTKLSVQPWTANENAIVSSWLQSNAKPLAALREAVKRTYYYNPLVPKGDEKGLNSTYLQGIFVDRELARALACRAMLSLGHGDTAEAQQDLVACRRLGRVVGRGATLIEGVVAIAIEQVAFRAEVALLAHGQLDARAVEGYFRDLFTLPPLPDAAEQIDSGERLWLLDTLAQLDRHGWAKVPIYTIGKQVEHGLNDEILNGIDWNPAFEVTNKGFDRLTTAFRTKDRVSRAQQLSQIEAESRPYYDQFVGGSGAMVLKTAGPATERGRLLGQMLFAPALQLLPQMQTATDCTQQTFDITIVAHALVWYQRVNSRYPDSLAKLAPTYLNTIPGDLFSGKELVYRLNEDGFLLYSVGVNGVDDGATGQDGQPPGDDIVVRIPYPSKP